MNIVHPARKNILKLGVDLLTDWWYNQGKVKKHFNFNQGDTIMARTRIHNHKTKNLDLAPEPTEETPPPVLEDEDRDVEILFEEDDRRFRLSGKGTFTTLRGGKIG